MITPNLLAEPIAEITVTGTAIAKAQDPVRMARAMKLGVEAGREAFLAGRMPKKLYSAAPSSPVEGKIAPSQPKAA